MEYVTEYELDHWVTSYLPTDTKIFQDENHDNVVSQNVNLVCSRTVLKINFRGKIRYG